ncbi:hypothetical protein Bbelb_399470 [Branchiostoma belcheri]|nr:hypothetical protein Bbelb_399470 [Branchiostoma belcheri]
MNAGRDNRIFWADLACRDLGFREGLATHAYLLTSEVVSGSSPLRSHYRPLYPSAVPRFVVSQTLPQWEGATLRDAIDRVDRGSGYTRDDAMCLACAAERDDLAAQVTCTSDHLEVSFPRPPDNSAQAADVQLAAPPCRAEQNSTHIYIRTALGECGTTKETTLTEMIYRNTLTVGADPSHGGITWQLTKVPLECRLPRNKTLPLDFRPHLKSVFRSGVLGEGDREFRISMELFRTNGFWRPVTEYPVFVELHEVSPECPVFVCYNRLVRNVRCLCVTTAMTVTAVFQMIHVQIQVFPHTCVAMPSDDPSDRTRNDVIIDGCAKLPTLQFYPSPGSDRGRFGFQAFAYTSGVPTVYLHCDVLLCKALDPNSRCAQGCQTPSGRRRREAEPEVYRLTQGPIVLGDDQTGRKTQDLVTVSAIIGACALLLAAAMFGLGIQYKARREGRQSGYRVLENTD